MRLLKKILLMILIASMLVSTVSCKVDDNDDNDKGGSNTTTYTVEVLTPFGKPLSDVTVFIHKDGGEDYNVCKTITTDSEGRASATLESAFDYSVGLMGYSEVYTAKSGRTRADRYALDSESVTITLGMSEGYTPSKYKVGDPMANFAIADIDGVEYELYELLQEKKAVVLNYWFYNCPYCVREFPSLNTAYNTYKDSIQVLAINDVDALSKVQSFENDKALTLDMPVCSIEYGSAVSLLRFDSVYYPVTVVIDRYGMVSLVHIEAVTDVAVWEELFAYYTSDSYDGTPYTGF